METQTTLKNLRLPDSMYLFDGLITSTIRRKIVMEDITDISTGKTIKTQTFQIKEMVDDKNKSYALNRLAWMLHERWIELVSEEADNYIFQRDRNFATIEVGPFAGNTYWYPGKNYMITPFENKYKIDLIIDLGASSTTGGVPEPTNGENPLVTVERYTTLITKQSKITSRRPSFPTYKLEDLCSRMNMTKEQLKNEMVTTFIIDPKNTLATNRICNTSVIAEFTLEENGNLKADGKVFYDGVDTQVTSPSGKITSYDKTYPGHLFRWRLYNNDIVDTSLGTSATVSFSSNSDDSITIVAGDKTSYDSATKTLTYNKNKDAYLWASFEELPAQGKNWGGEAIYFLSENNLPIRIS
jgi:hypothetical protein